MKRDPRLRGLSSDHHRALVLARRVARRAAAGTLDPALAQDVLRSLRDDLEPHFVIEEEVLLPALENAGAGGLARRTLEDHGFLKASARAAAGGALEHLAAFAERLASHVRFEEQELFPACEEKLSDAVLEEVARRAPHPPTGPSQVRSVTPGPR